MRLRYINRRFIDYCLYTVDSFSRMHGGEFPGIALHRARQTYDPVLGGDPDVRSINGWLKPEFLQNVLL